ncbi:MAG: glycosyltransferase family 2 protein [Actinomycetota bacterium]
MPASVVIVAYDSGPVLERCVDSVRRDDPDHEVIVVNNGARAAEIDAVAELPGVELVEAGGNIGFAAGCTLGAEHASSENLVFLNPDATVEPGAIEALSRALEDPSVGIAMARLRLMDQPELLNSTGCVIHFTGLAWSDGYGEPADSLTEPREITYANGSALAIRTELFRSLGGFTPELFIYHEDLELGWRVRMRGLRVVIDPAADVLHEYDYSRNVKKNYFMERNRLIFVSSAYSLRMLLLLAPALLAAEAGLTIVALRQGWFRDKVRGWAWVARNARWLAAHRRKLQSERVVPDRDLARHLASVVDPKMVDVPGLVKIANPVLERYWALVRRLA